ncbi:MAG: hypothetical protein K5879_03815 [Lachnospiraceae bacterium]|nr:hypothetical protein [Lachnospiraceae bacterium]
MKIQVLECPKCHATLENDNESLGTFFCKYCGQKIVVEELQDAAVKVKVREMEIEHEEKKMEYEQRKQNITFAQEKEKENRNSKKLLIGIAAYIAIMALAFVALGSLGGDHKKLVKQLRKTEIEVQEAIRDGDYDYAMIKVNELRLDDNYSDEQTKAWDEKREDYIELIKSKQKVKK